MAFSGGDVPAEQVEMVAMVTGFENHSMIANALKSNHGNVETVINEYLDDADKFKRKYGWDEAAFSSGREDESTSGNNANIPAFQIHPPVIYGTEPKSFWDAPSRPPSRANNRSPMSRLVDATAPEFTTDAPSNRQEEEDHLQRAINESLNASGVQSPQTFPPPPPPLPQQSGVTTNNGDSSVHFGPANRPDYDPDEWAMVRLGNQESDPDPSLRARKEGAPALLRCRFEISWKTHRVGALLMIYQQIPAVRNALLQTGDPPGYGYGNKSDWWQGQPIPPPGHSETDWIDDSSLSWSDELHRLIAFLETTERTYGTADVLTRAKHLETKETGDPEKDFFENFSHTLQQAGGSPGQAETLMSSVEIVSFDNFEPQHKEQFGILDLQVSKDADPQPENIYNVLDWLFFVDLRLAREDSGAARIAWITEASEVITCRFQGDEGLPRPLEIPETFYLDRYMKINAEKVHELQLDMVALLKGYDASMQKEEELIRWVNPQTNKIYDRRVLIKAGVQRCQEKMRKIRQRAFWRQHEQAAIEGEGEYYLPEHGGEPSLLPDEAQVVAHYEAKIHELEAKLVEMERVMNEHIIPERQAIHDINRKMSALLTVPSADEKWNPTHKYTLRGVANGPNTVYQRMRGPASASEATPTQEAPVPGEEGWWKISFKTEDNTVEHTPVAYETVMREACGAGCQPILVFATDKAMAQEPLPLSGALKTFVRLDNRHFKQELSQSTRHGSHKRSAGVGDGSQSKRLQRSVSIDSMATNHASAGDFDEDMRDAPFDNDSMFGAVGDAPASAPDRQTATAPQDEGIPDVVEFPPLPPPRGGSAPLPAYANDIEMETGMSPALAQVSLQDAKGGGSGLPPSRVPEMQERPNTLFLTRPNNNGGAAANGAAAAGVVEEEPLIDLGIEKDAGPKTQVNGG